ncbi:copper resistance CopC family protein [Aestuariibacter salexigens]|uniref:copper resistance CopC family protein n=1 Tax=Aestuariibacter salexigens TaxID=226010 RepID=UPI0004797B8B|nr:copper resistance protein CopC [Aestuariibacter salexigens]
MKNLTTYLLAIAFVFSSTAFAHVQLKESKPTDNAMLSSSPQSLSLTFSSDVRLVKVMLAGPQGKKVDFGFKPVNAASDSFSWDLPQLSAGNYKVDMIFFGQDGHKMTETLNFMVH